jgi:hypothetical protein
MPKRWGGDGLEEIMTPAPATAMDVPSQDEKSAQETARP